MYRSIGKRNSPRKFTRLSWIGAIWRRFSDTARAAMSTGKVASDCCIRVATAVDLSVEVSTLLMGVLATAARANSSRLELA
jgi:hypothetical protein